MDFNFTPEQRQLRESVSRYLDRSYDFEKRQELVKSDRPHSDEVWAQLAELGILALPFDEDAGGVGGNIVDLVAVAEIFGEHLLVEPFISTVVLGGQALAGSDSETASGLLERIIGGEALVAFAHEEGRGTPDPAMVAATASSSGDGHTVSGAKALVLGAPEAEAFVVTARTSGAAGDRDGLGLFLVQADADGVQRTAFKTVDGRSAANVTFENAPAELLADNAYERIQKLIADAIVVLGAEAVGAMGELLKQTSAYTSTRKQFGVPILSFQALAHRVADMKLNYTKARSTSVFTTALAEAGQASARDIAVLKAQTGRLGRAIGESAVQAHGGIGMTDELAIGHYLKRLMAIDALFGNSEYQLRLIGGQHAS